MINLQDKGYWRRLGGRLAAFMFVAASISACVTPDPQTKEPDSFFNATYAPIAFDSASCNRYFKGTTIPKYVVEKQGYFNIKVDVAGFESLTIDDENVWSDIVKQLLRNVSISEVRTIAVTADVSVGENKILVLPLFTLQQVDKDKVRFTPVSRMTEFGSWLSLNVASPVTMVYTVRYARTVDSSIVKTIESVASAALAVAGGTVGGPAGPTIVTGLDLLSNKASGWDSQLGEALSNQQNWHAGQAIRLVGSDWSKLCTDYQRGAELNMTGKALPKEIKASLLLEIKSSQIIAPSTELTSGGLPNFSGAETQLFPTRVINLPPNQKPKDFYATTGFYQSFQRSTADQASTFGGLCKDLVDRLVGGANLSRYDAIGILHGELSEHVFFTNSQKLINSGCLKPYASDMAKLGLMAFADVPEATITHEEQLTRRNIAMNAIAIALKTDRRGARLSRLASIMADRVGVFDETGITGHPGGYRLERFDAATAFTDVKAEHFGCYWWPKSQGNEVIATRSSFFSVPGSDRLYFLTVTFDVVRDSDESDPVGKITSITIRDGNPALARRTLIGSYGAIKDGETADKYNQCVFYEKRKVYKDFDLAL